jgi:chorismate synthase
MSSITGDCLKISVFGESHGPALGVVIDGLPSGLVIDFDYIDIQMKRRKPSSAVYSTKRKESDKIEILSGIYNGRTTGTPLCAVIYNKDTRSEDYDNLKDIIRPGHADYTGRVRYKGFNDFRGGGHFSGRLTAPIVFAGAITDQILQSRNIFIGSHIDAIYNKQDIGFDKTDITKEQLLSLRKMDIPVNDKNCYAVYLDIINEAAAREDSVGGIVETAIIGIPAGLGSPMFDNIEAKLASMLFSIPAVKGVEFGKGFNIVSLYGSQANDSFYINQDNCILTRTNNNGGINGGITNGMPVTLRVAIKPTASITTEQDTVNIKEMENVRLKIKGRHDACIVPRAVPVIEAACSLVICDMLLIQCGLSELSYDNKDNKGV